MTLHSPSSPAHPHISLRDVQPGDLATLFAFQSDPESCAMAMVKPRPEADFMGVWDKIFRERAAKGPEGTLKSGVVGKAIWAGEGPGERGEICGAISCFQRDGQDAVGYMIARGWWGRGIASRAVALLLAELPPTRRPLRAFAAASNAASIRVLIKNGFTITGTHSSPETERYVGCEEVCFVLE